MTLSNIPPLASPGAPPADISGDLEDQQFIFRKFPWAYNVPGYSNLQWDTNDASGGFLNSIVVSTNSNSMVTDSDGVADRYDTSAVADQIGGIGSNTGFDRYLQLRHDYFLIQKFKHTGVDTNLRFVLGFINGLTTNVTSADDIDGGVYLAFSSTRSDTNWQFIADDDTTQTVQDSGVAKDNLAHYLIIEGTGTGTSVKLTLKDANFIDQASHTFTTQLPSVTLQMAYYMEVRTLTTTAQTIQHYSTAAEMRGAL